MKSQTGANYIRRQKQANQDQEEVCTYHIKRESKLTKLPSGAVRRKRNER